MFLTRVYALTQMLAGVSVDIHHLAPDEGRRASEEQDIEVQADGSAKAWMRRDAGRQLYKASETLVAEALHPQRFSKLGVGYCKEGLYAGGIPADATLEACKPKCDEEEQCRFFALHPGVSCSRYDSRAGDCEGRVTEGGNFAPEEHTLYAKTEKADPRFRKLGTGHCLHGFYAGWKPEEATTLATCAATCGSEEKCRYFAFAEGKTCSRYSTDAKDCSEREAKADHTLYAKTAEALSVPHFTKLGPGYCARGAYAGGTAADTSLEACQAKCEAEEKCKFFALYEGKNCSRFDTTAGPCSGRVTQGGDAKSHTSYAKNVKVDPRFRKLGTGRCQLGYYVTGDQVEAQSLTLCAAKCGSEADCRYFAFLEGESCSRYNSEAQDCGQREASTDDALYAKTFETEYWGL